MCKAFRKIQSICPVAVKQQHKVTVRAKAVSIAQRAHLNGIRISKFLFHASKTVCDHFPVPYGWPVQTMLPDLFLHMFPWSKREYQNSSIEWGVIRILTQPTFLKWQTG